MTVLTRPVPPFTNRDYYYCHYSYSGVAGSDSALKSTTIPKSSDGLLIGYYYHCNYYHL